MISAVGKSSLPAVGWITPAGVSNDPIGTTYEDVTLEYTRSRTEWSAWRRSLEERLGRITHLESFSSDDAPPPSIFTRSIDRNVVALPGVKTCVQCQADP